MGGNARTSSSLVSGTIPLASNKDLFSNTRYNGGSCLDAIRGACMSEQELLERITFNPSIFGGKPIIRGRRLAVEHILGMLAAGDSSETILEGYPWLEKGDIQACLLYARRLVGHERIEQLPTEAPS